MEVSSELLTTICIVYDVIYAVIGFFGVAGESIFTSFPEPSKVYRGVVGTVSAHKSERLK